MARLSFPIHPARVLDRLGLTRISALVRSGRWAAHELRAPLRPDRAVRLGRLWLAERSGRRAYRVLREPELRGTRRSDVVFVFGSGRSLVDIGAGDWERISKADIVGFSHFHRQRWVRVDYHLIAEVPSVAETAASIRANPLYADTIYGVMRGFTAEASNELVGRRLLPSGARIFRWRRIGRNRTLPPSPTLGKGLVHGTNSILDIVNFALVLGWRRIVIAGVDLYNKEYFWLPAGVARPDEKTELTAASRWPQADQIVETLDLWRRVSAERGVDLCVYDGRSLLASVLPIFAWD